MDDTERTGSIDRSPEADEGWLNERRPAILKLARELASEERVAYQHGTTKLSFHLRETIALGAFASSEAYPEERTWMRIVLDSIALELGVIEGRDASEKRARLECTLRYASLRRAIKKEIERLERRGLDETGQAGLGEARERIDLTAGLLEVPTAAREPGRRRFPRERKTEALRFLRRWSRRGTSPDAPRPRA